MSNNTNTSIIPKKNTFGKCPHCHNGQTYIEDEIDNTDVVCLHCGYRNYIEPEPKPVSPELKMHFMEKL